MNVLANLNARFKIGTRVNVGFGIILALLIGVAALSYFGLTEMRGIFANYSAINGDTARVLTLDRDFTGVRRNILVYTQSGSDAAIQRVQELSKSVKGDLDEAIAAAKSGERKELLQRVSGLFDKYMSNFDRIIQQDTARDHAINNVMNPIGEKIRAELTDILRRAINDNYMEAAAFAGSAQESLVLAQLNATRFLLTHDKKFVAEFDKWMPGVTTGLLLTQEMLQTTERKIKINTLKNEIPNYEVAFHDAVKAVDERNRLVNDVDAQIADELAAILADIRTMQANNLAGLKAWIETNIASTIKFSLAMAGAALALGLLMSWLIGRGIAKPIRVLVGFLQRMAKGETIEITGVERKDEVGETARAVNEIKVMLADKVRQEAEAKAEADKLAAVEREAAMKKMEAEFEAVVGSIVTAAVAGDFSQRVDLAGKTGIVLNIGTQINSLCENVAKALDDLIQMLNALAEGNLTERITADYQGNFALLKDNANKTADRIGETIGEIKTSAREVTSASAEITTSTTDLSQRTEEQAASLEETSASMEQISTTVKKNAENARAANQSAADTRAVAERGGQVVAHAVDAMAKIEESSRKISDIIGVIDEIARQTNLLALNAAVEAARAGEAGRGFAVVASEVRSLAQRSSQAAKDIKDLITNSNGQVKDGVELVNKAGASLHEIVESIKKVAEIVSDIANASAEQASGIEQVGKALTQMDEVTQQNSALVEENAATAKTLEHQAHAMDERVAFFKLAVGSDVAHVAAPAKPDAAKPATAALRPSRGPAAKTRPATVQVGKMQAALAVAVKEDADWKEF